MSTTCAVRGKMRQSGFLAGVYDANPNVGALSQHGTDFSLRFSYGALAIVQTTYQWSQGRAAQGLPGSVTAGAYYESSRFTWLADPSRQTRGSYGAYLYFDQMLFRGAWPDYLGPPHLRARRTARSAHEAAPRAPVRDH
jgi:carbohydrate-selective porin OprB